MSEFDEDIQEDYDNDNVYALACVAQDLRDTLKHVAPRAYIAAQKRKNTERAKQEVEG